MTPTTKGHHMHRRALIRAASAVLLLPLLMAAEKCGSGGEGEIHTHAPVKGKENDPMAPEDAKEDWPINGNVFRELRISAWFPASDGRYSLVVVITDHSETDPKLREITLQRRDVTGQLVVPVSFDASHDISAKITCECAKAPKLDSKARISTRERNARGGQVTQAVDVLGRQRFEWSMSPRRR